MLSLSVFKVSFKKFLSNSDLISESDLEKIASLDIESSFDYEKDECYFCYIITNQIEIEKYKKILEKNYIGYTCKDISEYIIKNEYDIDYIGDYLDENNYYLYDIFLDDLDTWIYSKLDLDIILDIISAKGMNSLREIDRKFLKDNYQTDDE
jgi:hypothetical protein